MGKLLKRNSTLVRSQTPPEGSPCITNVKSSPRATHLASSRPGISSASKLPSSKYTSLFRRSQAISKHPKIEGKDPNTKTEISLSSTSESPKSRKLNAGTGEYVKICRLDGSPYPEPDLTHKPRKSASIHDSLRGRRVVDDHSLISNTETSERSSLVPAVATKKIWEHYRKTDSWHSERDSHHCAKQCRCVKCSSSQASHACVHARVIDNLMTDSVICSSTFGVASKTQNKPHCPKCGNNQRQKLSTASQKVSFSEGKPVGEPGLSVIHSKTTTAKLRTHVRPVSISTEPRTSSTYETDVYPVSPTSTLETPLVQTTEKANAKKFRNSAIVMLVRTISNQGKNKSTSSVKQLNTKTRSESPKFLTKINSAVGNSDNVDYSKLKAVGGRRRASRSPVNSPEKEKAEGTFEMLEASESQTTKKRNSWDNWDQGLSSVRTASMAPTSLELTVEQGSMLTRFRSLREGVGRAAGQISQSSSLKRMSGLPEMWAGSDIIIESAGFGYLR